MFISPLRWYRFFIVSLFTLLGIIGLWLPAQLEVALSAPGSTITVNSPADVLADDGVCTLREAITAANTDTPSGMMMGECNAGNGTDTIVFSDTNAPFTVTLAITGTRDDGNATGDLDIFSDVTIQGNSAFTTTIDANQIDRVLDILTGTISLNHIRIINGSAPECIYLDPKPSIPAEPGGGIRNMGFLQLNDVIIFNNKGANGQKDWPCPGDGSGGGIWNSGFMTVSFTRIISNHAGDYWIFEERLRGGGGIYNQGNLLMNHIYLAGNSAGDVRYNFLNSEGAAGGNGGAIYNSGILTVNQSTILKNRAGTGADAPFDIRGPAGKGGDGGGIFSTGLITIMHSSLVENQSGRGGDGARASIGGRGGAGGAIFVESGHILLANSTVEHNVAGMGGRGGGGGIYNDFLYYPTFGGISGDGGAMVVYHPGSASIINSTIFQNEAPIGGKGGGCSWGCPPAGRGLGGSGGAFAVRGHLSINNSTISTNNANLNGGAIFIPPSSITETIVISISQSTFISNSAYLRGGGIFGSNATITLFNSIVGANHAPQSPDCFRTVHTTGYMLLENVEGCTVIETNATGNIYNHPPLLLPLADNGGNTLTHALDVHSPALDAGNCPPGSTDQRGEPRPFDIPVLPDTGNGCDIGAVEMQNPQSVPTRTPTATATAQPKFPTLYLPLIHRDFP